MGNGISSGLSRNWKRVLAGAFLVASFVVTITVAPVTSHAIDLRSVKTIADEIHKDIITQISPFKQVQAIEHWSQFPSYSAMQGLLQFALQKTLTSAEPDTQLILEAIAAASSMISLNNYTLYGDFTREIIDQMEAKDTGGDQDWTDEIEEFVDAVKTLGAEKFGLIYSKSDFPIATVEQLISIEERREINLNVSIQNLDEIDYDEMTPDDDMQGLVQQLEAEEAQIQYLNRPPEERFQEGLEKINEIRAHLEANVIGQPEVIEALISIEFMKLIYGTSHPKGVTLKLMGLPGVGKDTTAMAWVDAIHGEEGAWVDHMLRMPTIKDKADLQKYIGSPPGYVGSDDLPALVKFMVDHSGGKYILVEKGFSGPAEKPWFVALNPKWKGENLPGYATPDEGVVFLNEIHGWSKEGRDAMKTFTEEGRLQIANPGTGEGDLVALNEIVVPIRRIEASNELITLIATNRRTDGTYVGEPQEFDQLLANHQRHHRDYPLIRKTLVAEGSARSSAGAGDDSSFGVSQESLNRIKDQYLLLMRPLSPEDIQKIIKIKLRSVAKRLSNSPNGFKNTEWLFSDDLVSFVQEWNYVAEDGARASEGKVESIFEMTLIEAIIEGRLSPATEGRVFVDIKRNEDGTYRLEIQLANGEVIEQQIQTTESARYQEPLTAEELQEIYTLGERLSQHVFGIPELTRRIGDQIASRIAGRNENPSLRDAEESAQVYMFLGLSSTGKTELSKAIAREVYGTEERMLTIPFGEIKTAAALGEWITGTTIGGKVKKSKLMEMWDRTDGNFVLNLDELSNAPLEVQEGLYDLLREKTYSNFIDREPRLTQNLIITVTGNAGEDWFTNIPRNVPIEEQQAAMYEIYRQATENSSFMRAELEQHFKKALINRVGMSNIFFFPPLSYQAIRQLTAHRLGKSIQNLKQRPNSQRPGWNLQFLDETEYEAILKVLETEGFELFEQGASLVRYVSQDFEQGLRVLLGRNGVTFDSNVTLYLKNITEAHKEGIREIPGSVTLGVLTEDGRDLDLVLERRSDPKDLELPTFERVFTAFHEAGHEIVRHVLLGNQYDPSFITIVKGVGNIGGQWIQYLGLASSEQHTYVEPTKQNYIYEMAVLAAGDAAEDIVAKGGRTAGGKRNDMMRSTLMAYRGILCLGLSDKFGVMSCPSGSSLEEMQTWVATMFTEESKALLEQEVRAWQQEARVLARDVMLGNFELLEKMSYKLLEQGQVEREELEQMYGDNGGTLHPRDINAAEKVKRFSWSRFFARFSHLWRTNKHEPTEFVPAVEIPETIADISAVVRGKKNLALEEVELSQDIPLADNADELRQLINLIPVEELPDTYKYGNCAAALSKK